MKPDHIIFLHLPKNGGTTINSLLDKIYKSTESYAVIWVGEQGNLEQFIQMQPNEKNKIKILKGHFDFGLHKHFEGATQYFTFLRRPETRIASFYFYVKRTKNNRLYKMVNEEVLSFKAFVELGDKDGNNGQIRKLSGINATEEVMYAMAIKHIEQYIPVVGLQELFDESLIVLAHHFGWQMPYYLKQNEANSENKIDDEDMKLVISKNQGDIKLHDVMKQRLLTQMQEVPFFKFKLFKLRLGNFILSKIKK